MGWVDVDVRHESRAESLEEAGEESEEAGEVSAETSDDSSEGDQEGESREEQSDEVESPRGAGEVVVVIVVQEAVGDAGGGVEVALGVKGDGGASGTAVGVAAVFDAADGEVGPAGGVVVVGAGGLDAGCVGLEEVHLVDGRGVEAREDDEELHDDGAGDEDDGYQAEHRACGREVRLVGLQGGG
jgi:hypothetical protein